MASAAANIMGFRLCTCVFIVSLFAFSCGSTVINGDCKFPTLFGFGDSNTDTGACDAFFHNINWPNGKTVGKVFKRACDERLIIDFLAKSLGLPYLNASLDTNGTSFKYGANFAFAGETINPGRGFPLDIQVTQFRIFKSRVISGKEPESKNIYPKLEAFSEGLYIIDISQNDVGSNFSGKSVPTILNYFTNSVQRLLKDGAKYLWVHNTCPYGCLPRANDTHECENNSTICTRDKYGCIMEFNKRSQVFNFQLQQSLNELRRLYPSAVITLVDIYAAKNYLVTNNIKGFDNGLKLKFCCGTEEHSCGVNNTYGCDDPSKYLSWDGIHFTEAANRIVAKLIANGTFSEPRAATSEACHKRC